MEKQSATRNPPPYEKRVLLRINHSGRNNWQLGKRIRTDINGDYYILEKDANDSSMPACTYGILDWQDLPD